MYLQKLCENTIRRKNLYDQETIKLLIQMNLQFAFNVYQLVCETTDQEEEIMKEYLKMASLYLDKPCKKLKSKMDISKLKLADLHSSLNLLESKHNQFMQRLSFLQSL